MWQAVRIRLIKTINLNYPLTLKYIAKPPFLPSPPSCWRLPTTTNKAAMKHVRFIAALQCRHTVWIRSLFAVMFVRNSEFLATARAASSQNATTILSWHPLTEAVLIHPSTIVGLKCSFHCFILIYCYILALRCKITDFFSNNQKITRI